MNINIRKYPRGHHIAAALVILFIIGTGSLFSLQSYREWGVVKDKVISKFIAPDKYIEFSPASRPEYDNKIMNYIVAIDSGLRERIIILRSKKDPEIDFLFVDDKLYCVLENYDLVTNTRLGDIVKNLSSVYGKPNIQKDKTMTIYSFFSSDTKVLVLASSKSSKMEVKAYYYASKLFKMLIMK